MSKYVTYFLILFLSNYASLGQVSITKSEKNCIEMLFYNSDSLTKQTINPYFLGFGRRENKEIVFELFDDRVRFCNDTLFLFLNDTAIVPSSEKYNVGDSLRFQNAEKFDTLKADYGFKVKYTFSKMKYSTLAIYYLFNNLAGDTKKSKLIILNKVIGRKR